MLGYLLFWTLVVSVVNTEPYAPPLPQGRPATPDELSAHINTKMLNGYRQMLLLTQLGLARLEADAQKGFDNRDVVESARRIVEDLKQRIAALEGAEQRPRPAVQLPMSPGVLDPFDPANKPKPPKPPVRD